MAEVEHERCNKCKCWRLPASYLNAKGRKLKTCTQCRDRAAQYRARYTCEHGKQKYMCVPCGGSTICEHGKPKYKCVPCGGSEMCEHGRSKYKCVPCGGSAICEHGKQKHTCRQCDGSAFCEHGKQKYTCRQCDGSAFCEHGVYRASCKTCKPMGHIRLVARSRIRKAMEGTGTAGSLTMLGCTVEEFKNHITAQLHDGMTWANYGRASTKQRHWNIDHITPLKYGAPTLEEMVERLHYTNTQPLWASDNRAKGNKYVGRPGDEQHP